MSEVYTSLNCKTDLDTGAPTVREPGSCWERLAEDVRLLAERLLAEVGRVWERF